jgi:hypothetical protein
MAAIVKSISESVEQRQARNSDKHTEDSLAGLIEQRYQGEWIYSHMRGAWYIRDEASGQYEEDHQERVLHLIREFLSDLNSDNNAKLGSAATIAAVEKLARRSPALAIIGDELDADPRLLGTPAGVFDLRPAPACGTSTAPSLRSAPPSRRRPESRRCGSSSSNG